jgi:hypothetical protein
MRSARAIGKVATARTRKGKIGFGAVRDLARALPRVEEGTAYGSPALKVGGKMFACIAINRSAEPNTLAVRVAFRDRDEMIAADPDTFYVTDHYVNYPCVLVRLSRIHPDALRDLLRMGWEFVARSATRTRNAKAAKTAKKTF